MTFLEFLSRNNVFSLMKIIINVHKFWIIKLLCEKMTQDISNSPEFDEIAVKLNAILERASQIDQELMTLESIKQQNGNYSSEMKSFGPDKYINFPECRKYTGSNNTNQYYDKRGCGCNCRSSAYSRREVMMGRREATSGELCQIMDVINELRMQVSALATRQNQMKSELNKIRGRLC